MNKDYWLVVSEAQLKTLRLGLNTVQTDAKMLHGNVKGEQEGEFECLLTEISSAEQALHDAELLEGWLPQPTHNGEWAYRPKGHKVFKSVVFVDGITPTDKGHILSDLAGELDGKSVAKLPGTWKQVIIP